MPMTSATAFPRSHYPIRAVARLTGLSIDTLRAWERRYRAVVPKRSPRGRVYSDADIARLRRLAELVDRGHAISAVAALPDTALKRLLGKESEPTPQVAHADVQPLLQALDRFDVPSIEAELNRYAAVLPPRELIFAVIIPLLQLIGQRWASGELRPSQEHLVSAIVRSVMGGLLRTLARAHAARPIVFAAPSGERHELGLLSAALLAASAGFGVVYLGVDLPAGDIVAAADATQAELVVVSLTTANGVASTELAELADLPANTELWVGGAAARASMAATRSRARLISSLDECAALFDRRNALLTTATSRRR